MRFTTAKKTFTEKELDYFSRMDYKQHNGVGIILDKPGYPGVGTARYFVDPNDPTTAEWSVIVVDKFHGQGLEIYGVSLDNDNDKWLGAIREHGMGWVQVSDLNGFDNLAAKDYAVQSIPSNFLIDAQGRIVAKNLRGEDLYKKVEELLGK